MVVERPLGMDMHAVAQLPDMLVEGRLEPNVAQRAALQPVVCEAPHLGDNCAGVFIHAEGAAYDHAAFRPWRVQALGFKAIRGLYPDYDLWRDFPYEYEFGKLAIDVINGGPGLREWVDDAAAVPGDLDSVTAPDEAGWEEVRRPYLLY